MEGLGYRFLVKLILMYEELYFRDIWICKYFLKIIIRFFNINFINLFIYGVYVNVVIYY